MRPGVFVPRRRTERLARAAVDAAREVDAPTVVDLCCGSGAIAAVVADDVPGAVVHAADVDAVAVACAAANLIPRGVAVHRGDLMEALPTALRGRIDVLVANVPYVPSAGLALMPPEARLHEPEATRDGGADGLDVLRRVARGADPGSPPTGSSSSRSRTNSSPRPSTRSRPPARGASRPARSTRAGRRGRRHTGRDRPTSALSDRPDVPRPDDARTVRQPAADLVASCPQPARRPDGPP